MLSLSLVNTKRHGSYKGPNRPIMYHIAAMGFIRPPLILTAAFTHPEVDIQPLRTPQDSGSLGLLVKNMNQSRAPNKKEAVFGPNYP